MEHTPDTCPNKELINNITYELKVVKDMYHKLDKQTSSDIEVIKSQNDTIIRMLTGQTADYKELFKAFAELEKKFMLNQYQTDRTTSVMDKASWWVVTKSVALLGIVGAFMYAVLKGV